MQGYPFAFDIMSSMEKQPIYTLQTYNFENADLVQPPERDFEPHELALNCLQGYRMAGLCVDVGAFTAALPQILPPGDILLNQLGIATAKVNSRNVMIPSEREHKKDLNLLAGPMLHALASERKHKKRIDHAMLLIPALFPDAVHVEPTSKPNVKSVILDHVKLAPALRKTIMMMTHWLIADTVKTWEEHDVVPDANFSFNPEDIQFIPSYLRSIANFPLDVRTSVLERVSKLEDFLIELHQSEMPLQIAGLYDYEDAVRSLQEKVAAQAQANKGPVQPQKKVEKIIPDQKKLDYVIAAEKRGLPITPPKKKEERAASPYDAARAAFLACIENICNLEKPNVKSVILDHVKLAPALRKTIMMMTHWLIADTVKTWEEHDVVPDANFSFNPEDIQFIPSYLRSIANFPLDVRTSVLERVSKLEDFLIELHQSEMPLQIAGLYDYEDAVRSLQEKVAAQAQANKGPVQPQKKVEKIIPDQKKLDYVIAAEKRGLPITPPKKKEERAASPYDAARAAFLACIENICNLEKPSDTELDRWTLALQEFISIDLDLEAQDVIALIGSFRTMHPEEIRKRINNLFQGKELDYNRAYLKATFLQGLDEKTMYEMLEQGMIPHDLVNVYDALAQGRASSTNNS